jgi:mono/diheme cytochrome c family protein
MNKMLRAASALGLGLAALAGASAASAAPGAQVYAENCAACHQPAGQGVKGAFPALAKSKFVTGDQTALVSTVLNGRGGMPAFNTDLTPEDLASVLTYIRASWGNKATPIGKGLIVTVRSKSAQGATRRAMEAH